MNISNIQLQELRRFAALGRISASILHEISNPLSAAMLNLELSEQNSPHLRRARQNMRILRRYVEAARIQIKSHDKLREFKVETQISQLKQVLLPMAKQADVKLVFVLPPPGTKLYGDSVKFQQIIANLAVNAIQAYEEKDTSNPLAKIVRIAFAVKSGWLTIEVTDWGKGIAPSQMPKLFEPFYSTKTEANLGLGIGLTMVKRYVSEDFNGSISVRSTARLGTRFSVRLRLP